MKSLSFDSLGGFYGIIDRNDPELARQLVDPDLGGAKVLQLRMKTASSQQLYDTAVMVRQVTEQYGALFVVNDRVDIAIASGADGVHLGQEDLPPQDARAIARKKVEDRHFVIGYSTHNAEQVKAAANMPVDYLGFGPVYATSTKQDPDPVCGLETLQQAVELAGTTPVVAIGGITADNSAEVFAAGARFACAIQAVYDAESPALAIYKIQKAYQKSSDLPCS